MNTNLIVTAPLVQTQHSYNVVPTGRSLRWLCVAGLLGLSLMALGGKSIGRIMHIKILGYFTAMDYARYGWSGYHRTALS